MVFLFFFKQKTAYEMRISDWSSDVCSSDLRDDEVRHILQEQIDGRVGIGLVIPFHPKIEIVGEIRLEERIVARSPQGAHALACADIQDRPEIIETRPGHGARRIEPPVQVVRRSEERRVGKECVSTCRSRWSPYP